MTGYQQVPVQMGGVMIWGLWDSQVDAIIDVKLGDADADADTYKYKLMTSLLTRWENIKKDKHGKHCNDQRKPFFSICSWSGRNDREGSPSHSLSIQPSYGREKGKKTFSSTGVGKRTHRNCHCDVLLMDDPLSLAPKSPERTRYGLGPSIRDRANRLNCKPSYHQLRG